MIYLRVTFRMFNRSVEHCSLLFLFLCARFQMRVHHPCGRHDDASGGWAANDTQWKVRALCTCVYVAVVSSDVACVS